jgi:hypothetical protein
LSAAPPLAAHFRDLVFDDETRGQLVDPPFVMEGAMNGHTFVEWVRQFLVPTLKRRDVVTAGAGAVDRPPCMPRAPQAPRGEAFMPVPRPVFRYTISKW